MDASDLVARLIAGDAMAEDELVRRYSRGIEIIAGQQGLRGAAIEDVRQETLRIAIEKIRHSDLEHPESLSGFICGIARNLALKQYARSKEYEAFETALVTVADRSPTQLDRILDKEKAALVRAVLNELRSPRDREVLRRFYFEEQSKEEICTDLGLGNLHFNRVLFRAKERYRELYRKRHEMGGMSGGTAAPL